MKMPLLSVLSLLLLMSCHAQAQNKPEKPGKTANIAHNPLHVDPAEYIQRITLPPGFRIEFYQRDIDSPRSLALSPAGNLFIGTRTNPKRDKLGKVYVVTNPDGDQRGDETIVLAENLNIPNGVAFRDGSLYVAELNRVIRYDEIEGRLHNPPAPKVLNDSFPEEFHHGWKYLRIGPDDRLYVPVGAPCNICEPAEGQGTIVSMALDGSDKQVYARGIRNSVGFDWHPDTDELWFTDNGRDLWGDDIPPEELNHAPIAGLHFGYPYRYGKDLVDDEFETTMEDSDFTPSSLDFPAHNALLGMRFYTGNMFPQQYHGDLFIAAHGSWNRSVPDGYRIYRVKMEQGKAVGYEIFADGWLTEDNQYWGRPVDIELMADGSMLVSDDFAGVIYRISYGS